MVPSHEDRRKHYRRETDTFICEHCEGKSGMHCSITPEELEYLIDQAAEKASKKALSLGKTEIITTVGSFVITKSAYVVGAIVLGLLAFLSKKGFIVWP